MANLTLTREEIKSILARKYGTIQADCQDLQDWAWQELVERDDAEAYRFNRERALDMMHYVGGIQAAAEALGIGKDELAEAAAKIRKERGL